MKITTFISTFILLFFLACKKENTHPLKGDIVEAVYGLGTVESNNVFEAKAGVMTSVSEFFVKEGQDVHAQDKLYRDDSGTTFRAPFSGRVTQIPVFIKENIFPPTTILTVMDLNSLYLAVSLEQQGAMKIKKGMKAEVSFEFFRNQKLQGIVETIYPKKDQFIAKVQIAKWPSGVLPGMTADVAFEIDRKKDALLIPVKAISNGNIIVIRNSKKEKMPVKIGLMDLERAELLEPILSVDDELVIP